MEWTGGWQEWKQEICEETVAAFQRRQNEALCQVDGIVHREVNEFR